MALEMVLSQQVLNLKRRVEMLEYLLDLKLPVDVTFNRGKNKAGTSVRTLALRIQAFNEARKFLDAVGVEDVKRIMRDELANINRVGGTE